VGITQALNESGATWIVTSNRVHAKTGPVNSNHNQHAVLPGQRLPVRVDGKYGSDPNEIEVAFLVVSMELHMSARARLFGGA